MNIKQDFQTNCVSSLVLREHHCVLRDSRTHMQPEGGTEKQLRSEAENEASCGGMRDGHHYLQQQKNSLAHSIEIRAQFMRGNQKYLLTIQQATLLVTRRKEQN